MKPMFQTTFRTSLLLSFALLFTHTGCHPADQKAAAPISETTATQNNTDQQPDVESPKQTTKTEDSTPSQGTSNTAAPTPSTETPSNSTDPLYIIRYKYPPEQTLYFVIENIFQDNGGVVPLLSFTDTVEDRRTVIQHVDRVPPGTPHTPQDDRFVRVTWTCDRYEVRERGMGKEIKFDSLRDLYPPGALRSLGTIPGSKVRFAVDRNTAETQDRQITVGVVGGPITRKRATHTAERCLINADNVQKVMDDLGALFIPMAPQKIGDTWQIQRKDNANNFGTLTRTYRFKLKTVNVVEGTRVATIEVEGDLALDPAPKDHPGSMSKQQRNVRLDRSLCQGSIQFDIDKGRLVSMLLRRDYLLKADIEATKDMQKMSLESGASHTLRVKVLDKAPPKPVIVGGPKAPAEEPEPPPPVRPTTSHPTTRPALPTTTQPKKAPMRTIHPTKPTDKPVGKKKNDVMEPSGSRPRAAQDDLTHRVNPNQVDMVPPPTTKPTKQ